MTQRRRGMYDDDQSNNYFLLIDVARIIITTTTMADQVLTEKQQHAKHRVESAGGMFIDPSLYKRKTYKKSALLVNPNQVAAYATKKAYKPVVKALSPEADMLVDEILDPEGSNEIVRWPNTYGLSAVYKCKNILNASFSDDNRCSVVVHPRLRNAIFTTSGMVTAPRSLPSTAVLDQKPWCVQEISMQAPQVVDMVAPISCFDRHVLFPVPNSNTGKMLYQINFINNASTSLVQMAWTFPLSRFGQVQVTTTTYDESFGTLTKNFDYTGLDQSLVVGLFANTGPISNMKYFSLEFTTNGVPWTGIASGYIFTDGDGNVADDIQYTLGNIAAHMIGYDLKDADNLIANAERSIVLSQSLLLTAEMSSLNDGGTMAIARVPGGTQVGESSGDSDFNNWYQWIASLPTNAYDGAVKHGGYAFYIPDDERGYFYRDNAAFFNLDLPYIVSEFTTSDSSEGSIIRIKVNTIVQFTTNSSVYSLCPSPIVCDICVLHHLISLIPAAYSNEGHKEGLRNHLKVLGKHVKRLLKDPKTYINGGKALATLAALI